MAGSDAPVRGLVHALGLSSCVLMNERRPDILAIPSITVIKNNSTTLIIGADDEVVEQAYTTGILYGAYHNVVIPTSGVSALWGGGIGKASNTVNVTEQNDTPVVVVGGKAAMKTNPNNMAFLPTHIIFVEKDVASGIVSEADAIAKYVILTLNILFL